ncbi:hypothetical protein SS50377_24418 [Spironucleus salmonicida]|uniref:Uncharacterized protein n=1 Tax=Spironucleus salmonicida TaxID=348837 RepID=V6LMW9_9EUKA|nr:hypothetical protein SS50377_24418 [Spironucleus salmonicida]|eukprot:EST46032.1 Hypothetical protein SS50377_14020 [Spironucleus salmonicida]
MDQTVQTILNKLKKILKPKIDTQRSQSVNRQILHILTLLQSNNYEVDKLLLKYPLNALSVEADELILQHIKTPILFSSQTIKTAKNYHIFPGFCSCKNVINTISYDQNFLFSQKCRKCAEQQFDENQPLYQLAKQAFCWFLMQKIDFNDVRIIENIPTNQVSTNIDQYMYNSDIFCGKIISFQGSQKFHFFDKKSANFETNLKRCESLFYQKIGWHGVKTVVVEKQYLRFGVEFWIRNQEKIGFILKEFGRFYVVQCDMKEYQVEKSECKIIGHADNYNKTLLFDQEERKLIGNLLWNMKGLEVKVVDLFQQHVSGNVEYCIFLNQEWYFIISNQKNAYIIQFNQIVSQKCIQLHKKLYYGFDVGQDMLDCAKQLVMPQFFQLYVIIIIDQYYLINKINNYLNNGSNLPSLDKDEGYI